MYFKGLGVKTQLLESILLVKKSSDRRDGKSQNLLAYFYYSCLGVEKNVEAIYKSVSLKFCSPIKNQPKLKFHIIFNSIVAFVSEVVFIDMKYN